MVITFDPTIVILISLSFWQLDIQSFSRTPRSPQFEFGKTSKRAFKVKTEKCNNTNLPMSWWHQLGAPCWAAEPNRRCASKSMPRAINSPWHPKLDQNWKFGFLGVVCVFLGIFFLSFLTIFLSQKTQKYIKFSWFFSLLQEYKLVSYPPSSSPWFHSLDLRFNGYRCSFLATIHTSFSLKLHQDFYLFFLLE